jgi:predicted acyl esterase
MRSRALVPFLVLAVLALPTSVSAGPDPIAAAQGLGLQCAPAESADGVRYTRCEGELTSFDGVGLDTTLSLPIDRTSPFPTLLMLHGWGGDKTNWQSTTQEGDGNPDKYHWNNVWFVSRGYAVVNYTARGFQESCGANDNEEPDCVFDGTRRPWIHLADRRWEARDAQHILGLLVDAGIADPERLASTGGSYGGGQSWLLATSMPWESPDGRALQLSAAVPKYPWTSLINALIPNGRASDDIDQSRSHEEPFGVMKLSYVSGLYAAGQPPVGHGRYNGPPHPNDPTETHSRLHEQYARTVAGEPYDPDPTVDAFVAEYRQKSAYHAEDYFAAVAAESTKTGSDDIPGFNEVPVFSIQGWTDPLFPSVETLQMYRKLKAFDPNYPIYMAFGDIGHSNAQNPPGQWRFINRQGNQFLNTFVLGQGRGLPTTQTFAFVTECPADDTPYPPLSSTEWDRMTSGTVTLQGAGGATTTSAQNPGLSDDPVFSEPPDITASRGCITKPAGEDEGLAATWEFPVPRRFTMLGLPEVRIPYELTGVDATVAVRIWDVPPSGEKILVDRSAYRLTTATDGPAGLLSMDTFGNAWEWEPGHVIQVQVSQQDAPFLRPNNLASQISWGPPEVTLPIRQGFDLVVPGA